MIHRRRDAARTVLTQDGRLGPGSQSSPDAAPRSSITILRNSRCDQKIPCSPFGQHSAKNPLDFFTVFGGEVPIDRAL